MWITHSRSAMCIVWGFSAVGTHHIGACAGSHMRMFDAMWVGSEHVVSQNGRSSSGPGIKQISRYRVFMPSAVAGRFLETRGSIVAGRIFRREC